MLQGGEGTGTDTGLTTAAEGGSGTGGTTTAATAAGENSKEDSSIFEFDEKAAQGYYTKEQWDAYVNNFKMDCKTNTQVTSCANSPSDKNYLYDSRTFTGSICTPLAPKITSKMGGFGDISGAFEDLKAVKWAIIGSIVLALLIS